MTSFQDIDEVSHESIETKHDARAGKQSQRRFPGPNNTRKISTETPLGRKSLRSLHQKANTVGGRVRISHAQPKSQLMKDGLDVRQIGGSRERVAR